MTFYPFLFLGNGQRTSEFTTVILFLLLKSGKQAIKLTYNKNFSFTDKIFVLMSTVP